MTDQQQGLGLIIEGILDDGYPKSTGQVLAELEAEYPGAVEELAREYRAAFGLSGCGERMAPFTIVAQELARLQEAGKVTSSWQNKEKLWRKV